MQPPTSKDWQSKIYNIFGVFVYKARGCFICTGAAISAHVYTKNIICNVVKSYDLAVFLLLHCNLSGSFIAAEMGYLRST